MDDKRPERSIAHSSIDWVLAVWSLHPTVVPSLLDSIVFDIEVSTVCFGLLDIVSDGPL